MINRAINFKDWDIIFQKNDTEKYNKSVANQCIHLLFS